MPANEAIPLDTFFSTWNIQPSSFTTVIEQMLGQPLPAIVDSFAHEIYTGASNARVYRLGGRVLRSAHDRSWSLIFKILQASELPLNSTTPQEWMREALVYQSTFLSLLPSCLHAPRCYGVIPLSDTRIGLWLEEIIDAVGTSWPFEHYGVAAYHLGQFSAAFCNRPHQPAWSWLRRSWLRQTVEDAGPQTIALLHQFQDHPVIGQIYPSSTTTAITQLWEDHGAWLTALDQLPQTVCHNDAFSRNLFARVSADGQAQTVVIDWASVGLGAVGQDLGPLVAGTLDFGEIESTRAAQFDTLVFEQYIRGLQASGWHGDPLGVRFAYCATAPLLYELCYTLPFLRYLIAEESGSAGIERIFGQPIDVLITQWKRTIEYRFGLADEARRLLERIG